MTDHRFRAPVVVVASLGVLMFIAALVLRTVSHTGLDPTESGSVVTVYNDTSSTVTVRQCRSDCGSSHEKDQLLPGRAVRVAASTGSDNWWAVTGSNGELRGCLLLGRAGVGNGSVSNVSAAGSCPAPGEVTRSGVLATVVGFALFFLAAGIGVASIVFATAEIHRRTLSRGVPTHRVTAATALAAVVAVFGGWLVFDFYVVLSAGRRLFWRPAPTADTG